jgi:hypothetical protein
LNVGLTHEELMTEINKSMSYQDACMKFDNE